MMSLKSCSSSDSSLFLFILPLSLSLFLFLFVQPSTSLPTRPLGIPLHYIIKVGQQLDKQPEKIMPLDLSGGSCPNWDTWPFSKTPAPIEPVSHYCEAYHRSSCCSYDDTLLIQKEFANTVLFPNEKEYAGYGPKCHDALLRFFCYPCDPNFGKFFVIDPETRDIKWRICEETCIYLFQNCEDDPVFSFNNSKELCNYLETTIENATYSVVNVTQVNRYSEKAGTCFMIRSFPWYRRWFSGGFTWNFILLLIEFVLIGVGYFLFCRRRETPRVISVHQFKLGGEHPVTAR